MGSSEERMVRRLFVVSLSVEEVFEVRDETSGYEMINCVHIVS